MRTINIVIYFLSNNTFLSLNGIINKTFKVKLYLEKTIPNITKCNILEFKDLSHA